MSFFIPSLSLSFSPSPPTPSYFFPLSLSHDALHLSRLVPYKRVAAFAARGCSHDGRRGGRAWHRSDARSPVPVSLLLAWSSVAFFLPAPPPLFAPFPTFRSSRRWWAPGGHLGGVRQAPARVVGGRPVLRGLTGHAEVVRVVYDPQKTSYEALLKAFWENHDPTQGMQQEEDVGTQYRSVIHTFGAQQRDAALKSKAIYQQELAKRQLGPITTEIQAAGEFYYAEDYHQQYLHKSPKGYCGQKGTGVACPIRPAAEQES
uniref:peptide-methionine (S)-S-oxide reductase n=1 Tax=Chrysemys picta bellii TaxID=8478 RepID=A0A8C3FZK8_CHRPI